MGYNQHAYYTWREMRSDDYLNQNEDGYSPDSKFYRMHNFILINFALEVMVYAIACRVIWVRFHIPLTRFTYFLVRPCSLRA